MKSPRLALVAFLFTAGVARLADAQINSRLAVGGEFTVAATDHASTEDHAHSTFLPGIVWRFGATDPGWGFHWGLNWYAVDIERPIGGTTTELGELRVRPIMAGYGYTWIIKKNAITADLLGGYAFAKMALAGTAIDLRFGECLSEIGQDVVGMLDSDGQPHVARRDAGGELLLGIELLMCSRGRMDRQRACIADIGDVIDELERVDEPAAGLDAAL